MSNIKSTNTPTPTQNNLTLSPVLSTAPTSQSQIPLPKYYTLFTKIPRSLTNYLYSHSLTNSTATTTTPTPSYYKYIPLIFLYSGVNCNIYRDYIIDTNLAHIVETFYPNEDSRKNLYPQFLQAFNFLLSPPEDSNLSPLFTLDSYLDPDNITKTSRLIYYNLNKEGIYLTTEDIPLWDSFSNGEFYYLINRANDENYESKQSGQKQEINLGDLINIYIYLKSKSVNFGGIKSVSVSLSQISTDLSIGRKTVTKYINILTDWGMIDIKKASSQKDKNSYYFSDTWEQEFRENYVE